MFASATGPAERACIFALIFVGLGAPSALAQPASGINWRTDYNTARKEAQEKDLPLFIVVGSDNCYYCKKLDAGPLRDPRIIGLLNDGFIPLKIDGNKQAALTTALKVQSYPTTVLAGPDGKIHAFIEGYIEADRMTDHLKRAVTATTTTDWMARDYQEASKAIGGADYPRAVSLLKGIIKEAADKPVGIKAKEVLDQVEKQAAVKLVRARDLEQKGFTLEALDALADLVKSYAGTQTATDAAQLMAGIAEKPENVSRQRLRRARDLLAAAKDDFSKKQYSDCLQKCEHLASSYADLPETKESNSLAAWVRNNPERLAIACEQMNEKTASLYLTLAESWLKKGQEKEAIACLEKVTKLCPNTRQAEIAQGKMTAIRAANPATVTGFQKP
jgi:thioredoxin-related protein